MRLTVAIKAAEDATAALTTHRRGCVNCHRAWLDSTPKRYCPNGSHLASDWSHANWALAALRDRLAQPPADTQQVMF